MANMNPEKFEPTLDIMDIVEAEQKLRASMAVHIRSLFKEPRSSEFHLNVSTNEESHSIASKIKLFSTPEGHSAAENFSEMLYLLGIDDSQYNIKPITGINDIEFIKIHKLEKPQVIWIRFHDESNFFVHTHTLSGFSSQNMSLNELAILYDILSILNEKN